MSRIRQRDAAAMQQIMLRASSQREAAASVAVASTQATVEAQVGDVAAGLPPGLSDTLANYESRLAALEAEP